MPQFIGTNAAEVITPGFVSPTVLADPLAPLPGAGADTIDGGGGADVMDGGGGDDLYIVDNAGDVVTENGAAGAGGIDTVQSTVTHTLSLNIERLVLTGFQKIGGYGNALANRLTGNAVANRLEGRGGVDTIDGGAGDDTLVGGAERDVLIGGAGNDRFLLTAGEAFDNIDGGAGTDTLDASKVKIGVVFDFVAGTATGHGVATFRNVENLLATGKADRILTDGTGVYDAGGGDDVIVSGAIGAETIIGGAGFDTLDLRVGKKGQLVDALTGQTNRVGASFTQIEAIITDLGDDTLLGTAFADRLDGGRDPDNLTGREGADTLIGGDGADVLIGGAGIDVIDAGTGNDLIIFAFDSEFDVVAGGDGVDTIDASAATRAGTFDFLRGTISGNGGGALSGVETFFGTTAGDVIISDGSGLYEGRGGDDTLVGGLPGAETLDGGAGEDWIDATAGTGQFALNLTLSDFGDRVYRNFEHALLGEGNDTVTGTSIGNEIDGGGGDDVLLGLGGLDTLRGGDGDDDLDGGGGADLVFGGAGDDSALGGSGLDYLAGDDGDDTLDGGDELDFLFGGDGDDLLLGGDGDDYLDGGYDNDTLEGGDDNDDLRGVYGDDVIDGGAGADFVYGGEGSDTLTGGDGFDILWGSGGADVIDAADGQADEFLFYTTGESAPGACDRYIGFDFGLDIIDLFGIDADTTNSSGDAFTFGTLTGKGWLYAIDDGTDTLIRGNTDDDDAAELEIRIEDGANVIAGAWTAANFIL